MQNFLKRLNQHPKLKRDIIESAIGEIIIFLTAYLLKEALLAQIGLILLIVIIFGFIRRIRHELY